MEYNNYREIIEIAEGYTRDREIKHIRYHVLIKQGYAYFGEVLAPTIIKEAALKVKAKYALDCVAFYFTTEKLEFSDFGRIVSFKATFVPLSQEERAKFWSNNIVDAKYHVAY